MVETIVVIRSLHILFAVLWAGAGVYFFMVAQKHLQQEEEEILSFIATSKHGPYMGATALGTVGFGLATWLINGGEAYTTAGNAILGIGALGAIIGMLVGFFGHMPNSVHAKKALDSQDHAALPAIGRREALLGKTSAVSISIALVAMITFRWF